MFPDTMFPDPMFMIFFGVVAFLIVVSIVLSIFRMMRQGMNNVGRAETESQPAVREREIIREIVKIRCSYCGNLYDELEDKCPHCGGKKA